MDKKVLTITFLLFLFITGCASFNPTLVDYRINLPGSNTEKSEKIILHYRQITQKEASLTFDVNIKDMDYSVLIISIQNESSQKYNISFMENDKVINIDDAIDRLQFLPIGYLFAWSIPWAANIALKLPIYYGIGWPLIGLMALTQANTSNSKIEDFIQRNYLPDIVDANNTVQGIIMLQPKDFSSLNLRLTNAEGEHSDFIIKQTIFE